MCYAYLVFDAVGRPVIKSYTVVFYLNRLCIYYTYVDVFICEQKRKDYLHIALNLNEIQFEFGNGNMYCNINYFSYVANYLVRDIELISTNYYLNNHTSRSFSLPPEELPKFKICYFSTSFLKFPKFHLFNVLNNQTLKTILIHI